LVVDDEEPLTRNLASYLGLFPGEFEVATAASAEEALTVIDSFRPDVLLTDIRLPGLDGFELVRRACDTHRPMSVIAMTGTRGHDLEQRARALGITALLLKPLNLEAVRRLIGASVQLARSQSVTGELGT